MSHQFGTGHQEGTFVSESKVEKSIREVQSLTEEKANSANDPRILQLGLKLYF